MADSNRTDVLIVGAGPVGLALAAELGWRGVSCLLIEQGDGVITTPKMNEVNGRTMEFCRRWGIARQVLDCPFPADHPLDAAFVTSLFGYEIGRVRRPARKGQVPDPASPYRLQACSQHWFDPMLQTLARSFECVGMRYGCRLESFEECDDQVIARISDSGTGAAGQIAARYLVGCDGVASAVRRGMGVKLAGTGDIGQPLHTFFLAPRLLDECGKDKATFFMLVDEGGMWGNMRIIDPAIGLWRLMIDETDGTVNEATLDREALLVRALGRPYAVEWLSVNIWNRRSLVAERYGRGRVMLAGDAVHQLSPTGALGMNTGIGDAVDLGWKLAAVLEGWGGAGLLDSYDHERRMIGERNVGMATAFYHLNEEVSRIDGPLHEDSEAGNALRLSVGTALQERQGCEFVTVGSQFGYRYDPSPIVVADGTAALDDSPHIYVPSARPGGRAPHVWLGEDRTILDLFGRGFVLLRFQGTRGGDGMMAAADARGVPLKIVDIAEPEAAALYERCLVLVRPDGHVAWRGEEDPADAGKVLDITRGAG